MQRRHRLFSVTVGLACFLLVCIGSALFFLSADSGVTRRALSCVVHQLDDDGRSLAIAVPKWEYGNRLSWYYGGRAAAHAMGLGFRATGLDDLPLLAGLPTSGAGRLNNNNNDDDDDSADDEFMRRVCNLAHRTEYPHLTPWMFDVVYDAMVGELRTAVDDYLRRVTVPADEAPWTRGERYAVVQVRCVVRSPDDDHYGPNAFSIVHRIPADVDNIYILHPPTAKLRGKDDPLHVCPLITERLQQYIQRSRPAARVAVRCWPIETTFVAMAKADVLVREAQSSFSLFAAIANSDGLIVSSVDFHFPTAEPAFARRPNWQLSAAPPLTSHADPRSDWTSNTLIRWLEDH